MKKLFQLVTTLPTVLWVSVAMASEARVIINLSEQRAYLVEQGEVTLVSPIASGKPGWPTPTGNFRIFNKDLDHRSRSFGSVYDAYGRVVNSNATPGSHVPRAAIIDPRRCRTLWNSARRWGCTPVTSQGIPRPTGACGCPETLLPGFSSGSTLEHLRRSLAARTAWLASERLFPYCPKVHSYWASVDESPGPTQSIPESNHDITAVVLRPMGNKTRMEEFIRVRKNNGGVNSPLTVAGAAAASERQSSVPRSLFILNWNHQALTLMPLDFRSQFHLWSHSRPKIGFVRRQHSAA
jgi:hypothetical protein